MIHPMRVRKVEEQYATRVIAVGKKLVDDKKIDQAISVRLLPSGKVVLLGLHTSKKPVEVHKRIKVRHVPGYSSPEYFGEGGVRWCQRELCNYILKRLEEGMVR